MRLRLREHRPRLDGRVHRVLQPRSPLEQTVLADVVGRWTPLVGDQDGLARLAALFALAARSRFSVLYVPLRQNRKLADWAFAANALDLVLVHHSLGLRRSAWPELRRRLGTGRPITVDTDEHRWQHVRLTAERWTHADFRDRLLPAAHAETLFLAGSRPVFRDAAGELAWAAGNGHRHRRGRRGLPVGLTSLTPLVEPRAGRELDVVYLDTRAGRSLR
ncbi:hypothetical protein [Marinactinospora rubrisoli]|uniref:Uncharacterized protein n=1 Tax=Marinactinospora rubrisoli TaxID=2715399 RepID=A0ABW2KL34_9ACTN